MYIQLEASKNLDLYRFEPNLFKIQNRGGQSENRVLSRFWEKYHGQNQLRTEFRTGAEPARTVHSDPP